MLDKSKLQNVKAGNGGAYTAGCPACMQLGHDSQKIHLSVLPDGRFSCGANQGDKAHNKIIYQLVGTNSENIDDAEFEQKTIVERLYEPEVLDKLIKDYSYWENKGIPASIVEPLCGGIATDGQMAKRWVIPVFNDNGKIIGFTGRRLEEKMQLKWKHVGQTSTWLLGGLDDIQSDNRVILVESIGDYLMLKKNGIDHGIVLFGVRASQKVMGFLISSNVESIIIATNNDVAHDVGQKAAVKIAVTLSKFFGEDKIKILLPPAKDFGDCSQEQIDQWKTEAGYD